MLILASLMLGMAGYHFIEGLSWIDAFLNAAMILGGMGPVSPIESFAGKLFAGVFALYSGLIVIVAAGVLFAPIFHRIIHKFHAETTASSPDSSQSPHLASNPQPIEHGGNEHHEPDSPR
ncbi:MAG: hypothetical protein U0744_05845 [Gemmataceae bacterium]